MILQVSSFRALDDYLKALRECPDEIVLRPSGSTLPGHENRELPLLTTELGVYDNYSILLRADHDQVVEDFKRSLDSDQFLSGQYTHQWTCTKRKPGEEPSSDTFSGEGIGQVHNAFNYVPGTVGVQIWDTVSSFIFRSPHFGTNEARQYIRQIVQDFNMTVWAHWHQFGNENRKVEGVPWSRVMATVIDDIARYIQRRDYAFCIPESMGWDHVNDFARMVYHKPQSKTTNQ